MWLMSNRLAAVRTAWCSSMMLLYWTGIPAGEINEAGAVDDVPVA